MNYLIAFILSFFIVVLLIPQIKRLAIKIDFVDRPSERKAHSREVPLLAGIGIFASYMVCFFLFFREKTLDHLGFFIGGLLILVIGIIDDWAKTKGKDFPALPKFIVQIISAILAFLSGAVFYGFTNPFNQEFIVLPFAMQLLLSVTWIFGVTTVINFIDGLDGLAGGISAISAITLFVVALAKGQSGSAYMSIILVGTLIGYLKYNKQPAQIFMGDAGATFIGYVLGVIALDGAFKQATIFSLLIPILALGVPIFDNVFVVLKRIKEGKPAYIADRSQVHYRLLKHGLKPSQVVIFLCLVNLCFGLFSIIITLAER